MLRIVKNRLLQQRVCSLARCISNASAAFTDPLQYTSGKRELPSDIDSTDTTDVLEPATGRLLCRMKNSGVTDVNRSVEIAKQSLDGEWGQMSGTERGKILLRAAQIIRDNCEDISKVEVHDTGKAIWEARADIEGCADAIEYYGGVAPTIAGEHFALPQGSFAYTIREPLGVVGGIGAWNYPFQMAAWKSGPALACGNSMVFKPSQFTPLTAVLLAEVYSEAGLPAGAFNVIQGGASTGSLLSHHPDVAKMTFTGSMATGTKIMEACAQGIKYITLELGGKSPLIIFDDCDMENAIKGTMMANFLTQGQVCSNGTRVYVQRSIYDEFVSRLVERVNNMKIGNPFSEDTHVGATISREQFDIVMKYIKNAKSQGAKFVCGGEQVTPDDPALAKGLFISPAVVTDVTDKMQIAREEVFGPVACIFPFDTQQEVIQRANNSEFGLAGGVFTKDLKRAHHVVQKIQSGNLYVNNYNIYPSQIPFGGYKKSGLGREGGISFIEYYTQQKTVYVEMNDVDCPF
ncbi:hypothetical protein CAPTEDRAFT_176705 [Capitella teleta]|uniref:Aldehyde dehydrogenase domain-containing protein n=1 Tax=Capitella teleta TaxID=283909 RepID=R7UVK5_CAPTE|nr:hypothetical protein CAPTEDRAFT_176705 [Capitella teleta]|eukprot:ELU10339.1 hypothetical protein CAPTEDRAFT_176705 [Capitella teleta]